MWALPPLSGVERQLSLAGRTSQIGTNTNP
jgi:hypothetical protein